MNSRSTVRGPSPDEHEAIAVLQAAIGAECTEPIWRVPTAEQRSYDLDLELPNGKTIAVEITSSDGGARNLASANGRVYKTAHTNNTWTIEISPLSIDGSPIPNTLDVRTIVKELSPLLGQIETEYQDSVDQRLFDVSLYNSLLQQKLRKSDSLQIRVANCERPDNGRKSGIVVALRPSAVLCLSDTDVLSKRLQGAIDKKHERRQNAGWLVIRLCDFGGGADQLRELLSTSTPQHSVDDRLKRIEFRSFEKILAYTAYGDDYAVALGDRGQRWDVRVVST